MTVHEARSLRAGIPDVLDEELVTTLAGSGAVRVERIVSRGHCSAPDHWYDQEQHELVVLIEGAARLEVADQPDVRLQPGDWIHLAPHVRHRVAWTQPDVPTIWLAVFFD